MEYVTHSRLLSRIVESFQKRDDDDKSGKITLSLGDYTDDENKRSPSPVKM